MFAYLIRDYTQAILFLSEDIEKINGSYNQEKRVSQILRIYIMNLREYLSAFNFLQEVKDLKGIKINPDLIIKWKGDLLEWTKPQNSKNYEKKLQSLIDKYLVPIENEMAYGNQVDNQVILFSLEGMISNHLFRTPKSSLNAQSLYWLGIIEKSTPSLYFLGDMYFVDCIKTYSNNRYAKKCYDSYYKSIKFGFTGSAGTNIPVDIKRELDGLKKLIK